MLLEHATSRAISRSSLSTTPLPDSPPCPAPKRRPSPSTSRPAAVAFGAIVRVGPDQDGVSTEGLTSAVRFDRSEGAVNLIRRPGS